MYYFIVWTCYIRLEYAYSCEGANFLQILLIVFLRARTLLTPHIKEGVAVFKRMRLRLAGLPKNVFQCRIQP
jgi:hypothetical protein